MEISTKTAFAPISYGGAYGVSAGSRKSFPPFPTRRGVMRALRRTALISGGAVLLTILSYAGVTVLRNNVREVDAGRVYRSGQMNGAELTAFIRENGIRSVVNLRGPNADQAWYRDELRVSRSENAEHFDARLSAGEELTGAQMDEIVAVLRRAPKPMLIHCSGGADRSGLVAALYRYSVSGCDATQASEELSMWYGHVPLIRPHVLAMDRSFEKFVNHEATRDVRLLAMARPMPEEVR